MIYEDGHWHRECDGWHKDDKHSTLDKSNYGSGKNKIQKKTSNKSVQELTAFGSALEELFKK